MSIVPLFLRSLLVTSFLSFLLPLAIVGAILMGFSLVGSLPDGSGLGRAGIAGTIDFLKTFGNGNPLEGLLTLGVTCSLVGSLFDAFASHRDRHFRED